MDYIELIISFWEDNEICEVNEIGVGSLSIGLVIWFCSYTFLIDDTSFVPSGWISEASRGLQEGDHIL